MSVKPILLLSLALFSVACGEPQPGNERGKDPTKPIDIKKKETSRVPVVASEPGNSTPAVNDSAVGSPGGAAPNQPSTPPAPVGIPSQPSPTTPVTPIAPVQPEITRRLVIEVGSLRNRNGLICFALFKGSDGFPGSGEKAVYADCVEIIKNGPMSFILDGLEAGTYAMSLWHDENRNKNLELCSIGAPKEGIAFSNSAKTRGLPNPGSPTFNDAKFNVIGEKNVTPASMEYIAPPWPICQ